MAVAAGVAAFVQLRARVDNVEEQATSLAVRTADIENQVRSALAFKVPPGTTLANVDKKAQPPDGWGLCGQGDNRNWEGRFLMGTGVASKVGEPTGTKSHGHGVAGRTGGARWNGPELVDNGGDRRLNHGHNVTVSAAPVAHTPEAIQVWASAWIVLHGRSA